jgi:hypothetical protein
MDRGAAWILTSDLAENGVAHRGLVTAGPLLQNWAMMATHGGGRLASRCSKTDVEQPPQAHHGVS